MADNDKTIRLKLELESAKADANVAKLESEINQLVQSFKKLEKGNQKYSVAQTKLIQKQKEYAIATEKSITANRNLDKSLKSLEKGATGASMATGSMTSAVMEVGRTISDAPYGIRGMANNLSQLASNLFYASKSMGGFSLALKGMWSAMLGPLGILIAIQTVISAFDYFSTQQKEVKEDVDETTKAIDIQRTKLGLLFETLSRDIFFDRFGSKDFNKDLEVINENFSEFGDKYKELTKEQKKDPDFIKNMVAMYEQLLQVRSSIKDVATQLADIDAGNREEAFEGEEEAQKRHLKELLRMEVELKKFFEVEKKKGSSRKLTDRMFKEQILDLNKFILQQQRDAEKSRERNAMRLLEIDQRYARKDLQLTLETFNTKQQLRFDQWAEKEASRKKMSIEEFKKEKEYGQELLKLQKSLSDADAEYKIAVDEQKLAQEAETQRKRIELVEKFNDMMLKATLKSAKAEAKMFKGMYDGSKAGSLGSPQSGVGADGIDEQIMNQERLMAQEQANFEETLAIKLENLKNAGILQAEREAIIAEDRFQFLTNMTTKELELERMKIDAKKNINQEYVSWVSGLGDVFKNIAGDNEELAMVALALEKGSAIADIIIKTQSANATVIADSSKASAGYEAASAQQASLFNPVGAAFYKAQAIQALASGKTRVTKNNIGAGISIAKIASTTLQSRSVGGSGGASASSSGGGRTFDFNLVGSTGENQLAQGIAGQLGNPVQAYVVSSQMTSQQQLDNAIQTSATIGD